MLLLFMVVALLAVAVGVGVGYQYEQVRLGELCCCSGGGVSHRRRCHSAVSSVAGTQSGTFCYHLPVRSVFGNGRARCCGRRVPSASNDKKKCLPKECLDSVFAFGRSVQ